MMTESKAIARTTVAIVISIALIGSGTYLLWASETGHPPFCSAYPPGGSCPGSFSYSFRISIDYSGPWQASYYGFHSVGAPSNPFSGKGNYTGGSFGGSGPTQRSIELSGPNTNGVTICVQVEKLDSSTGILTLATDSMSNSTSLPSGNVRLCESAIP